MAETPIEELVNLPALERFINEHVPGPPGPVTVEKHTAGFSNETFYVNRGAERWVMRRPPRGPLLPIAHDVVREYRFISGLYGKARVPRPIACCEDPSVIGAPFYLMERIDGHVPRFEVAPAYDNSAGRRAMAFEMMDALVELHAVDWRAAGITGRDTGYVTRQVERWASQWDLTRPRTRELPGLDEITRWLRSHIPAEVPHTVVHGDFKLDNVMFAYDRPRLLAILDWEMATIGDPLADLGYFMNTWAPAKPVPGYEDRGVQVRPLAGLEGFPSVAEMVARYEEGSGRPMGDFLFYRILADYKLIVITEGLYMHYLEGTAANPAATEFEWRVPMSIARTLALMETGG